MRLQDHLDFTTLQWVKPELEATLAAAREALQAYVERPADSEMMRVCAEHLHQAHGTLQMVELDGASLVTTELEALANELLADRIADREEAYAVMMRALMQLPDYLERLSVGHRDVPVVLLPLLNDLRSGRQQSPLTESALFLPGLDADLPEQAPAALSAEHAQAAHDELVHLRLHFQQQLLGWFRGQDIPQRLRSMRKTLLAITARCCYLHGRRLWWIAAGVLEGLEQGMLKADALEIRRLIVRVDRHIRLLIEAGENSLLGAAAQEVARKLLYIVAHAARRSPQMELLRQTYALDDLVPAPRELAHAQGSMAGHNRALLDSVSNALKDDLLRVKEALDLFLRQDGADPAQLSVQGDVLGRVGDTLSMLALAVPRRVIEEQRQVLDALANRQRPADEATLLDVAGALLYVEASLDDHIERLGSGDGDGIDGNARELPRAEALSVVAALMNEAIGNADRVKEAIVAFVESGWQHDQLVGMPALMTEISGAMRMLSTPRSAELAQGVGRFIDDELLGDRRLPSATQMEQLADAVAALEYYFEAVRDHRGGLNHILDVAEHSLGELGYWPVPAARAVAADAAAHAEGAADAMPPAAVDAVSADDSDQRSVESAGTPLEVVETTDRPRQVGALPAAPVEPDGALAKRGEKVQHEPSAVPAALVAEGGFNLDVEGIDDDIRGIFLEEMQEEIDSLRVAEGVWLATPDQWSTLTGIRRSFHTLKGSGRLVGASVLGEFAWKVENMLNRVLDKSIRPHAGVQALVRHAIDALPGLLTALKGGRPVDAPLSAIMLVADQLAAGQDAQVEDHVPAGGGPIDGVEHHGGPRSPVASVPQTLPTAADAAAQEQEPRAYASADTSGMPDVDPALLEILRSEVAQYLQLLRAAIQHSDGELPISEELLRAVHTLHGAVSMVDIPRLTQLLAPLEGLFKRLRAAGEPLPAKGVQWLAQAVDAVADVMDQFDVAQPQLPDVDALAAQVMALRDSYPESHVAHVVFDSYADEDATEDAAKAAADTTAVATPPEQPDVDAAAAADDPAPRDIDAAVAAYLDTQVATDVDADSARAPSAAPTASPPPADTRRSEIDQQLVAALDAFEVPTAQVEAARGAGEPAPAQPAAIEPVLPAPDSVDAAAPADGAAATAQPTAGSSIDPDLLDVFCEESRELLDHADEVLAQWRAQPEEPSHIAALRRDLHTLKGSARIAGLAPVGDLAHAVETLLDKQVRGNAEVGSLIATLEGSFDQLNTLVQKVVRGEEAAYPQTTIKHLLALAGEQTFADDAMLSAAVTPLPVPATPAAAVIKAAVEPPSELPELLPEDPAGLASAQEQIRVRAGLLDHLVNHAGEVAIYRSRLEQQVSGYRYNVVELEQTVARLRSQLRLLEIETETQIIARFQREHQEAGFATFDPLELDRYSQLQQYSRALGESVSDLASIQGTLDELTRQSEALLVQQSRVSTELQDGLLRTRMLPFDSMVPNLRRTLRQAAREQSKNAQLYVDGAHGEMDRNLLDRIKAPFEHMLRNAIAHGIETPAERRKAGKPVDGAVHIQVAREATEVVIQVSDDGRGLDRAAIRKRGIESGLLSPDVQPSDSQLLALITRTGFSTAGKVTQLAGRGVGMDVVANEIKQLGGSLSIASEHRKGTTFTLRVPFTLAVTQAILVRTGEATFAIPMTSVQGVARVAAADLGALLAADEPSFQHGDEAYGIHDLAELLGLPPGVPIEGEPAPLLLTRAGDLRAAIRIDAVLGSREIVVKSVGPQISSVPGVLGATILGDGSVLVILDLAPLVRHDITRRQLRLAEGLSAMQAPIVEEVVVRPLVMVVDDSITMRKVTGRVLERHGYEVSTAKDGVDALEKLHERVPELMLLDIEMPRMDGYELAALMKADPHLRGVPIIMITSRSGEKHRQRALNIGVDRYLGKPYQEADLLAQMDEVLVARALESDHD